MASINELLNNIEDNTWLGKHAFTILPDVEDAINAPLDWFNNLSPINYLRSELAKSELPHLFGMMFPDHLLSF